MNPTYSGHARDRMAQRNVTEEEVETVLADPSITYTDAKGNPSFVATLSGRRVRVVVAAASDPPHVITVIADLPEGKS